MTDLKKEKILAVIPARGGSKGIPRKNIKLLGGKPLIAWSIEVAKHCPLIDRVIVSTDDKEIANVAREYGAEVPFVRPEELAEDLTPTLPVIVHTVKWLEENEKYYCDSVILLAPTFPFRTQEHIKESIELLQNGGADSVISVVEVTGQYSPYWQFTVDKKGKLELFTGDGDIKKVIPSRQELPTTYIRNSALYVFKKDFLFKNPPSIYGDDVAPYIMDKKYTLDIDTEEDWQMAESFLKNIIGSHERNK